VRVIQRALHALLQVDDAPERIAFAFALGVFVGFSPLLGLHTVLGLGLAVLLRLSKVAVLIGVYMNNPWVVVPFYGFATWLGLQLTGLPDGISLPPVGFFELFSWEFWNWLVSQWRLLIPALIGSTILCIVMAVLSYPLALFILRKFKEPGIGVKGPVTSESDARRRGD
jgi:uncharacterized protein (DUF2062 family)